MNGPVISTYCHVGGCCSVTEQAGVIWMHRSDEPWYRGRHFTYQEWDAFIAGVKGGEFDLDVLRGGAAA